MVIVQISLYSPIRDSPNVNSPLGYSPNRGGPGLPRSNTRASCPTEAEVCSAPQYQLRPHSFSCVRVSSDRRDQHSCSCAPVQFQGQAALPDFNSSLGRVLDVHNIEGIVGRDVLLVDAGIEGQAAAGAGGCRDNGFGRAS